MDFFDNYVHDSRAWFKIDPSSPDNEADMHAALADWVTRRKKALLNKGGPVMHGRGVSQRHLNTVDNLTDGQRRAADQYARTRKIPRMITAGRELTLGIAGYLRFRKIYGGFDDVLLSAIPSDDSADAVASLEPQEQRTPATG